MWQLSTFSTSENPTTVRQTSLPAYLLIKCREKSVDVYQHMGKSNPGDCLAEAGMTPFNSDPRAAQTQTRILTIL